MIKIGRAEEIVRNLRAFEVVPKIEYKTPPIDQKKNNTKIHIILLEFF
jgi:hypothetical protein